MPSGIGELTSLCKLNLLVVNHIEPPYPKNVAIAELRDLMTPNNITGALKIKLLGELKDPVAEAREADLTSKHRLTELHIEMAPERYGDFSGSHHDEATLEGLKPHPNLRKFEIYWYTGQRFPSWAINEQLCSNLPNLVDIQLLHCRRLERLPLFGKLPFLKRPSLVSVEGVEYMESGTSSNQHSSASPADTSTFFPSLQELTLMNMDNLRGWWNETEAVEQQCLLSMPFSKLAKLDIHQCPNLVSFPLCPNVEDLKLLNINEKFFVLNKFTDGSVMANEIGTSSSMAPGFTSKLKTLSIKHVQDLVSMPKECLQQLSSLEIQDPKMLNTLKLGQVFKSLSSLGRLKFTDCYELTSFSKDLEFLIALEKLEIWNCGELDLSLNEHYEDDSGMPWKALEKLHTLELSHFRKLVNLPSGLQHLINLRSLVIRNTKVIALPEWICCLTSLESISLSMCSKLTSLPEGFRKLAKLSTLYISECPGLTEIHSLKVAGFEPAPFSVHLYSLYRYSNLSSMHTRGFLKHISLFTEINGGAPVRLCTPLGPPLDAPTVVSGPKFSISQMLLFSRVYGIDELLPSGLKSSNNYMYTTQVTGGDLRLGSSNTD